MFVKPYLFGALTLLSASSALALTCANDYGSSAGCASNTTAAGDCATLGYSQDNVDGCGHYLYCPFDTSYKRCATEKTPSCEELGFTKSSSKMSNWCGEIIECPYDSSYKLCKKMGCSQQDFTKDDKSDWCDNIVYCAADSSYTLCMEPKEWAFACNGYSLSSCPTHGNCSSCSMGTTTYYKLNSCTSGYTKSGNTCTINTCSGYSLYSCPANGNCTNCLSGSTKKFKLNSCDSGYVKKGNTCVKSKPSCPSGYVPYSCRYDQLARLSECQEEGHEGCYIGTIDGVYYSIDRYDCRNGCCRECEC